MACHEGGWMSIRQRKTPLSLWPQHLEIYKRCPQRYYLKYIRKRPGRVVNTTAMTRGHVTHNVIAYAFKHFRAKRSFPDGIDGQIVTRLPLDDYANREDWRHDVAVIGDWVDCAIETFDTRKQVIAVETKYSYPFRGRPSEPPFTLKAKVDLVLRQEDGAIEHIDWKTGKPRWQDEIQNIVCRIAVGRAFQQPRIVSTVTFLNIETGEADESGELSREQVNPVWNKIMGLATGIQTDETWEPRQNALCAWCPYYQHGCALHQ